MSRVERDGPPVSDPEINLTSKRYNCNSERIQTMPETHDQTNDDLQTQLTDFQTGHRNSLRAKYGLSPDAANAIPLGTAQQMEEHAKMLQRAVGRPEANHSTDADNSSRSTLRQVNQILARRYNGPKTRSNQ